MSDGIMFVNAALGTLGPFVSQFWERSVVAFQVVDSFDGDSARGDFTGRMGGVVRPVFPWDTEFSPNGGP